MSEKPECLPKTARGVAIAFAFLLLAWLATRYLDADLRKAIVFSGFGLC